MRFINFIFLFCLISTSNYSQTIVSGGVSGTWTYSGSPYIVTGNIWLNGELTIEPGVHVKFQAGGWQFSIRDNKFSAIGKPDSMIVFEPVQGSSPGLWYGITSDNNNLADTLAYCEIKYATNGIWVSTYVNWMTPPVVLDHCLIHDNLQNGTISQVYGGAATAAVTQLELYDSEVYNNGYNGLWMKTEVWPGAWGHATAKFVRTIIHDNSLAGVYKDNHQRADVWIYNCSIINNGTDGVFTSSYTKLTNSIIAGNDGYGVNKDAVNGNLNPGDVTYNLIWDNYSGEFRNLSGNSFGYPIQVNANGDSCDIYFNLYMDPQLVDPLNFDFNLAVTSPCIDAGTSVIGNQFVQDPDSTVPDIGALYYNQNPVAIAGVNVTVNNFVLNQNYPNPFNPTTTIRYSLPRTAQVKLTVFNTLGQRVAELVNERKPAGNYKISFDGGNLSSGVYLYRLQAGEYTETKKMLLVR